MALDFQNHYGEIAINEAFTQAITEIIFGYTVSPNTDTYRDIKKMAKIFIVTFGEEEISNDYFLNPDGFKQRCETYTGDTDFYKNLCFSTTYLLSLQSGKTSRQERIKKDSYYELVTQGTIKSLKEALYKKICTDIIIPKLKSLPKSEQKKYIEEILTQFADDRAALDLVASAIEEYGRLTPKELEQKKSEITRDLAKQRKMARFMELLYTSQDYSELLSIEPDGRVIMAGNPPEEIKDEYIIEYVYAHEHYMSMGYDTPEKKEAYEKKIAGQMKNGVEFKSKLLTKLQVKKSMAAMKVAARNNGYIVMNSIEECESMQPVKLDVQQVPAKGENLSFDDLRKIYEEYEVCYDENNPNASTIGVKSRKTGKFINDPTMSLFVRYASLWANRAGLDRATNGDISDSDMAFNEDKRALYEEFSRAINKQISDNGNIDIDEACRIISSFRNNNDDRDFSYAVFSNTEIKDVIYRFYRMQNPEAMLQMEVGDVTKDILDRNEKKSEENKSSLLDDMEPYFPGAYSTESYISSLAGKIVKSTSMVNRIKVEDLLENALKSKITNEDVRNINQMTEQIRESVDEKNPFDVGNGNNEK